MGGDKGGMSGGCGGELSTCGEEPNDCGGWVVRRRLQQDVEMFLRGMGET